MFHFGGNWTAEFTANIRRLLQVASKHIKHMKKGMIKASVLYPHGKETHFDMDYYFNKHLPMVLGLLGDKVKAGSVERGLAGGAPGLPPGYIVMAHMYFDSVEDFQGSFGPHAEKIMGDIAKFTNSQPVVQISEVMM